MSRHAFKNSDDNVIHSIEFEMGQVLDLRIEILNGSPMFFTCWNGKRMENHREYGKMMSKFSSIKKVLYSVFKWGYCEECRAMNDKVHHYTYEYRNGVKLQSDLCQYHARALEELEECGDITNLSSFALGDVER